MLIVLDLNQLPSLKRVGVLLPVLSYSTNVVRFRDRQYLSILPAVCTSPTINMESPSWRNGIRTHDPLINSQTLNRPSSTPMLQYFL